MRGRIVALVTGIAMAVAFFACIDLFHSTADLLGRCERDAQACADGAPPPASEAGSPSPEESLCVSDHDAAASLAAHACAWLGACELPFGNNAFGSCTISARLAYDCTLNPLHQVKGATKDRWACLSHVASCGDVASCLFGDAGGASCESQSESSRCMDAGESPTVRLSCVEAGTFVEDCALWQRDCVASAGTATCGPAGNGELSCANDPDGGKGSCVGTELHWCGPDGGDIGIDCAGSGAQACTAMPSLSSPRWAVCVAQGDAGPQSSCPPTEETSCAGDVSRSCAQGIREEVDCQALLGVSGSCQATAALEPPYDWTGPCSVGQNGCSGDLCADGGQTLVGCARGATFALNCVEQKLGSCRIVGSDDGAPRAACTPPKTP